MRLLPNLEYLNGLPVDRDALDEDAIQLDPALAAVQQEAIANGGEQVQERPGEEESVYEDTQNEDGGFNQRHMTNRGNDTSLLSAQSATRNADILAQNLDTEELEALAMCFDNIRLMRQSSQAMIDNNDDTALGDQFDEVLTMMIAGLTD